MLNPQQYLVQHNLFNLASLRAHSARNSVDMITSPKFPDLVMLHYSREAQLENNWNPFSRMSRGLIVDLRHKRVIARPFSKFFNIDEQPETKISKLVNYQPFFVSEKLDGSMLILFKDPNTGNFHLTTKGSFESEHGKYATEIMPDILKQDRFVQEYTFIFELITYRKDLRENLVVNYQKKGYPEGIYLIGARHKTTGKLSSPIFLQEVAKMYGLPTIKTYNFQSLEDMVGNAKQLSVLDEGYVIHFPEQDLLVKLKGEDYKRAHKFISKLSPTYLLEGLMYNKVKSLIEIAPEEYREDIIKQIYKFQYQKQLLIKKCHNYFLHAPKATTRKEFALWVQNNVETYLRGYLFSLFDQKPLLDWKLYKTIGDLEGLSPRILVNEKTN